MVGDALLAEIGDVLPVRQVFALVAVDVILTVRLFVGREEPELVLLDRKSTRLNSSHT